MFKDAAKRANAIQAIDKIKEDIRAYFVIKTWVSFLT
jgi:hypothetical protein